MKNLLLTLIAVSLCFCLYAQENFYPDSLSLENDSALTHISIFDDLAMPDSSTMAAIVVFQDSSLRKVVEKNYSSQLQEVKGFRIQLYSSNRGAYARKRAFEIKDMLILKHPSMEKDIYVTYNSPFWKVRVGNCQTQEKAQSLRSWITSEFPQFANETYIVPSIILIH